MSEASPLTGEGFLARWSRIKSESRAQEDPPAPPTAATLTTANSDEPPPELPPVEELTIDSDFSGFFHPKVDENLRRSALRKLFADPHFNIMDGLDIYIDDYSKTEPIPATMLAGLQQAQRILQWARESEADEAPDPHVERLPQPQSASDTQGSPDQGDNAE